MNNVYVFPIYENGRMTFIVHVYYNQTQQTKEMVKNMQLLWIKDALFLEFHRFLGNNANIHNVWGKMTKSTNRIKIGIGLNGVVEMALKYYNYVQHILLYI